MKEPTKADLSAENEQLREKVTTLTELLTAAGESMALEPASYGDRALFHEACRERLGIVAAICKSAAEYAGGDLCAVFARSSAETLRREYARPVRYLAKGYERLTPAGEAAAAQDDEPATDDERLLLEVHGVNPDNPANVRELRTHEAECTETNHTRCLAHLVEKPASVTP